MTVAYAAATHALTSLMEWRDLASGAAGNTYKRQLAAADSSSVHTVVDNKLGVDAQLQLDFGEKLYVFKISLSLIGNAAVGKCNSKALAHASLTC